MNILVVGAQFANSGAQAMLFVTVDEIRKRYPDAEIFYVPIDSDSREYVSDASYKFHILTTPQRIAFDFAYRSVFFRFQCTVKYYIKALLGRVPFRKNSVRLGEMLESLDAIFDISGYALGSKWGPETNLKYLNAIAWGRKLNIPVYVFPQSFGPFDYKENKAEMDEKICSLMSWPELIFAREKEGYDLLVDGYGLSNVRLSYDLVLTNQGIDRRNIFQNEYDITIPQFGEPRSVGILPNVRMLDHMDGERVISLYRQIVDTLLEMDRPVYLFGHASADLAMCRDIKSFFCSDERVKLIDVAFSCLEYEEIAPQFSFLVAARYHSGILAFKNTVPCILLGWAVKYREMAKLLRQEAYAFDLTQEQNWETQVIDAIKGMDQHLDSAKANLSVALEEVRQQNRCFEQVFDRLDEQHGKRESL